MNTVISQMLPSAVGVAISPLPIVAVVLVLVTQRANVNGPAFIAGWMLGIGLLGGLVLLLAVSVGPSEVESPTWVHLLKIGVGTGLLIIGGGQWRHRPTPGSEPPVPAWVVDIAGFSPMKSAGAAMALSSADPKNLLLVMAGAAAIATTGGSGAVQTALLAVFALIASGGVLLPIALYFMMGEPARQTLDIMKRWMVRNNSVIMAVLLVLLGAKQLVDGVAGLT